MKEKLKQSAVVVAALAVGCLAGANWDQPVWAGNSAQKLIDAEFEDALRKHFQKRFFNLIEATDEQREKLSNLLAQRMSETRPMREELRQGAVELSQMMARNDASDDQIIQKAHQLRDLRDKIMDERLSTVLKVRANLTQQQRQTVSDKVIGFITGNSLRGRLKEAL